MTEDGGLEKYVSMFGNLGKRRERGKPKEQEFTFEMAVEKFKLFSAVGAEGQESKASYGKGSTIILNQFPPGTILREKFVHDRKNLLTAEEQALFDDVKKYGIKLNEEKPDLEPQYIWWCVGDYDEKKGELTLFGSVPKTGEPPRLYPYRQPVYKFSEPVIDKRKIRFDKKKEVLFLIGKPGIIFDDTFLESRGFSKESIDPWRERRSTLQVDVMQFGIKEKVKEKALKLSGLPNFVLQREPTAGQWFTHKRGGF